MPEEVFSKLAQIINAQLGIRAGEIKPETKFSDLCLDSFEILEITMAVEEEYDIILDDDDVAKLRTVRDAVNLIETLI